MDGVAVTMLLSDVEYPACPQGDGVLVFHGESVPDPFRWLENMAADEVAAWVKAEEDVTAQILRKNPWRASIRTLVEKTVFQPTTHSWLAVSDGIIHMRSEVGDKPPKLALRDMAGTVTTLYDPNTKDNQASGIDVTYLSVSLTGRWVAFALAASGSDGRDVRLYDIKNRTLMPDVIPLTAVPTLAWNADESGFYYNVTRRLFVKDNPFPSQRDGVYFHCLGTLAVEDCLIVPLSSSKHHALLPYGCPTEHHLILKAINFVTNESVFWRYDTGTGAVLEYMPELSGYITNIIGISDGKILLETTMGAPKGRIIAVIFDPDMGQRLIEVIPEGTNAIAISSHGIKALRSAATDDGMILTYIQNATHAIHVFDAKGNFIREISLPFPYSVHKVSIDRMNGRFLAEITSFMQPALCLAYSIMEDQLDIIDGVPVSANVVVKQHYAHTQDGLHIPYSLIHSSATDIENAPCLLYGYGGWGVALTPNYMPDIPIWLALGGVFVVANVRGGGEFGAAWHDDGRLRRKCNTFDDFCAIAKHLNQAFGIPPSRLAAKGISNGGLLVAASMLRKPELFAAIVSEVPLLDVLGVLGTEKGRAIADELGDPLESVDDYRYIRGYSPLHQIHEDQNYPPILVVVAEHDETAIPGNAMKFIAALQHPGRQQHFAFLRVAKGAGHSGWQKTVVADILTDEYTFLDLVLSVGSRQNNHIGG